MKAFFFAPESPRPLAMLRIGLGLVFLVYFAARWPFAVELYSHDGLPMPSFPGTGFVPPAPGAAVTVILATLLLFALAGIVLGWKTQASLWTALLISGWFGLLDAPSTFKKYSVIGLHLMLLLSFSRCAAVWSLDARFDPKSRQRTLLSPAWPRRLMQFLICAIYWGAAVTKLRLRDYATGDLLMFSLLDDQWGGQPAGLWLATQPHLLVLASMAVLFFEMAFPLLIWFPQSRRAMLLAGVLFHVLAGGLLYLSIFSPIMLVALLAFVGERDLSRLAQSGGPIRRTLRRFRAWFGTRNQPALAGSHPTDRRPTKIPTRQSRDAITGRRRLHPRRATLLYVIAATLCATCGLAVQAATDRYGVFQQTPAPPLPQLPRAEADRMLAGQLPAFEDYFHRIEIASRVSNFHAFGARRRFRTGMTVYVLCRLSRNHPALELEGLLFGPDGSELARYEHSLAAGFSHAVNGFKLTPELAPGRYQVILQAEGYEVARKRFELASSSQSGH